MSEKVDCISFIKELYGIPKSIVTAIQVYNILVGILNIAGNAILIWGLCRTRQTKTISFQFIVIMSVSDLASGTIGLIFMTMMALAQYYNQCWLKLTTQAVLNACNYFSSMMVFLVAFDRYLHMKYLEQYAYKFTKKRGYLLVGILFTLSVSTTLIFLLPYSKLAFSITESVYFSLMLFFQLTIIALYHGALHAMRRNASQVTICIINHHRALGTAAKRVSICFLILTTPVIIVHILHGINMQVNIIEISILNTVIWFAFITFLANGFCSSIIFISQNIPIRRALRRKLMDNWSRIRSEVGAMQPNK